jgi:hypothetical protein
MDKVTKRSRGERVDTKYLDNVPADTRAMRSQDKESERTHQHFGLCGWSQHSEEYWTNPR